MAATWKQNQVDAFVTANGVQTTFTYTLGSGFTAGNSLVGILFNTKSVTGVADNASNTYTILETQPFSTSSVTVFGLANIVSVPTTITVTTSSAPNNTAKQYMALDEISGAASINGHTSQVAVSGTTVSSGNIVTTAAGCLIWGAENPDAATTVSVGSGFTLGDPGATTGFVTEWQSQNSPGTIAATFGYSPASSGEVFVVAFAPFIFAGFDAIPQFPYRARATHYQLAAISKRDEQWPFTATPNPLKMQGIYYDPQFPIRRRWRTFQSADEQWPFTAVKTPTQFGWDNPEKFPQRKRFRTFQSNDDEWLFTAVPTPGQFGWDNPERFPFRLRFRTFQSPDEQWPFTAVTTPTQFGWDNPEKFPLRNRFRTFQSTDEQWPFTAVPTPTQLGFLFPDPPPIRSRPRQLALISKQDEQWPFLVIAAPIVVPYDIQFPIRARFRTFQSNDEEWLFTAVLTPTQTGFLTQDPTPVIRRPQQLALMSKEDEQWLLSAVGPTTLEGAWYVDQTFPPVTAENPGAWFSPHAWFIKVI